MVLRELDTLNNLYQVNGKERGSSRCSSPDAFESKDGSSEAAVGARDHTGITPAR